MQTHMNLGHVQSLYAAAYSVDYNSVRLYICLESMCVHACLFYLILQKFKNVKHAAFLNQGGIVFEGLSFSCVNK